VMKDEDRVLAFFATGLKRFDAGDYATAAKLFLDASSAARWGTREGGEIAMWHAQALDAAGQKELAKSALTKLATLHPDLDVKTLADELLYILMAPRLQLGDQDVVMFDLDRKEEELRSSAAERRRKRYRVAKGGAGYASMEKEPEKYSLEWYMKKPKEKEIGNEPNIMAITLAVVVLFLTFLSAQQ